MGLLIDAESHQVRGTISMAQIRMTRQVVFRSLFAGGWRVMEGGRRGGAGGGWGGGRRVGGGVMGGGVSEPGRSS